MGRQTQTKLMKQVLKQSGLIRSRFGNNSSKKKDIPLIKTLPLKKNPGDKFRVKITKLSCTKTWSEIKKEWIVMKSLPISIRSDQCLCGKPNLKHVTYLKNIKTNHEIAAGNCCLEEFYSSEESTVL
ncbi:hypothetical protein I4U23_011735 [Adineta vaga]|nr:hypothetical protein I4U23_011735 [Adineta vaga]